MSSIIQLTPSQREALFTLVQYQRSADEEVAFYGPDQGEINIYVNGEEVGTIVQTPTLNLWEKCNYISVHSRTGQYIGDIVTISFVLRQEAFDYASFMAKPKPIRALFRFWAWMIDDMPAFLWGITGAVIIQIVFKILGF